MHLNGEDGSMEVYINDGYSELQHSGSEAFSA